MFLILKILESLSSSEERYVELDFAYEWPVGCIQADFWHINDKFLQLFLSTWIRPLTPDERHYMRGFNRFFPEIL